MDYAACSGAHGGVIQSGPRRRAGPGGTRHRQTSRGGDGTGAHLAQSRVEIAELRAADGVIYGSTAPMRKGAAARIDVEAPQPVVTHDAAAPLHRHARSLRRLERGEPSIAPVRTGGPQRHRRDRVAMRAVRRGAHLSYSLVWSVGVARSSKLDVDSAHAQPVRSQPPRTHDCGARVVVGSAVRSSYCMHAPDLSRRSRALAASASRSRQRIGRWRLSLYVHARAMSSRHVALSFTRVAYLPRGGSRPPVGVASGTRRA